MKTMKKWTLLTAVLLLLNISAVRADDDRPIQAAELPRQAQEFIQKYFPQSEISYAKMERDFFDTTYEVVFTNSSKAEFRKNGDWKEVDCKYAALPEGLVPPQIAAFAADRYPGTKIVRIERDKYEYEVKLSNGIELTFDRKFNLIDIDN